MVLFFILIIIGLTVFSGARISEIMSIKQENLELGKAIVKVIHPRSDPRNPIEVSVKSRFFLNKIKGDKFGVYYYPEFLIPYLKLHLSQTDLIYPGSEFLFPSTRDSSKNIDPNTVRLLLGTLVNFSI